MWQAQIRLDGVRVPAGARLTKARTWDDTNYVLAKSRQTVAWEARATRSPPMRQHSLIRCDASSSAARWPGSS